MPCHGFLSSVIGPDNRRPSATWLPNCHDSKRCARRHGRTPRHRRTSGSGQHTAADSSSAKAGAQLAHPGHSLLAQPARASAASSKLPSVADGEADHQARGTPELSSRLPAQPALHAAARKVLSFFRITRLTATTSTAHSRNAAWAQDGTRKVRHHVSGASRGALQCWASSDLPKGEPRLGIDPGLRRRPWKIIPEQPLLSGVLHVQSSGSGRGDCSCATCVLRPSH